MENPRRAGCGRFRSIRRTLGQLVRSPERDCRPAIQTVHSEPSVQRSVSTAAGAFVFPEFSDGERVSRLSRKILFNPCPQGCMFCVIFIFTNY